MRIIGSKPHGILDYGLGAFLVISPWLFGFSETPSLAGVFVTVGMVVLLVSLITNYPLGLLKVIAFPIHGVLETAGALGLLVSPWLFHFSEIDLPRNLAVISAVSYLLVIVLTDYTPYRERKLQHK